MKDIYGEIRFDVSLNCSGINEANEKINELSIGNKRLTIVDDKGNRLGELDIHNVYVNWIDED